MKSGSQLTLEVCMERYSEQKAVKILNGSSHTHNMELFRDLINRERGYSLPLTSCEVLDDKGKKIIIQAREFDERLLKAFFDQCQTSPELGLLSNNTMPLTLECSMWLRDGGGWSKSKRYSHIQDGDAKMMLKCNVFVGLLWYQMAYKYRSGNMVDPWSESEMGKHIALRTYCRELNKGFQHSHKNGDKDPEFINTIYAHAQSLIADRVYPPFEPAVLPPGVSDPLALPRYEDE